MQERVRLVNGRFSIKTRPGGGVFITIQVPLVRKEEHEATAFVIGR
jgi:hypothetical protein